MIQLVPVAVIAGLAALVFSGGGKEIAADPLVSVPEQVKPKKVRGRKKKDG